MKDYAFAARLRELRERNNYSQFQLAKLMDVSDKAVSKWETGNSRPKASACTKLALVLGVDVDQLLDNDTITPDEVEKLLSAQRGMLWDKAENRMEEIYGGDPPLAVKNRFLVERNALHHSSAVLMFDILAKVSEAARQKGAGFSAPAAVCFTAWLLGASEVNPLEPHYYCPRCRRVEFRPEARSGWDLPDKVCDCGAGMRQDGQDIPVETCIMGGENPFESYRCAVDEDFMDEAEKIIISYGEQFFFMERFHEDAEEDYERTPEGEICCDPDTGKPIRVRQLPFSCLMFRPKKKARIRKPDNITGPDTIINWGERTGQPTISLLGGFYGPPYLSKPTPFRSSPSELARQEIMERALRDYWEYKEPLAEMVSDLKFPDIAPYSGKLSFSRFISLICSVSNLYMTSGPEELAEKLGLDDLTDLPLSREEIWNVIIRSTAYPGYMSGAASEIMINTGTGNYLRNAHQQGVGARERKLFREMNLPDWFEKYAVNIMHLCWRSTCIEEGIRLLEDARRKIREGK